MQLLLSCKHTNVPLGILSTPFPPAFANASFCHPYFLDSLFSNGTRLAAQLATETTSDTSILFLASIHKLCRVRQDFAGLPTLDLVERYSTPLLTLIDWKIRVANLHYPDLHISKANDNFSCLENWILTAGDIKDAAKRTLAENEAKFLEDLENSRVALSLSGKPSNAKLWSWISTLLLGTQYEADSHGWLKTLFLSKTVNDILLFDRDEILLGTEIIESSLPLGVGLGPSVRKRLNELRDAIGGYYLDIDELDRNFEVESESVFAERQALRTNALARATENAPTEMPLEKDYASKVAYLVAKGKWQLSQRKS